VIRAVLLDALGTLVRMEPPAPRLQRSLRARLDLDLPLDRCDAAMRAEMSYYGAHCARASDDAALATLRLECADVLADVLAAAFTAFPDAAPALEALATQGRRLAVVSNWDVSLPPLLVRLALAPYLETVVHSAGVGASKPDPRPFLVALERLGLPPEECVHVGDDAVNDVAGAAAAGLRAILLDRHGPAKPGVRVPSLEEVPAVVEQLDAA
jgi:putative hydrolase of the HAD superfamily